jgi:hypothetical protein
MATYSQEFKDRSSSCTGDGLHGFFWPRREYGDGEAEHVAELVRRGIHKGVGLRREVWGRTRAGIIVAHRDRKGCHGLDSLPGDECR